MPNIIARRRIIVETCPINCASLWPVCLHFNEKFSNLYNFVILWEKILKFYKTIADMLLF